jgi:hypothetical protein
MAKDEVIEQAGRRDFLTQITIAVGGIGVAAACVPFVASMNPSSDVLAKATTEVDLHPMLSTPSHGKVNRCSSFIAPKSRSKRWRPPTAGSIR